MNTRLKTKVLSSKQKRLLFALAEGQSRAAAARAAGYKCSTWASTVANSPQVQAEIADLQALAARELVQRLPLLTRAAIDALGTILNGPATPENKLRAAAIVSQLALACLERTQPLPADVPPVLDLVPTNEEPQ